MTTLEVRLAESRYRPAGFDLLRIGLSASIILWHTILVCYGNDVEVLYFNGALRPAIYTLVPAFFAVSGFLVAGSLLRNSLEDFILFRILRIFPALALEVVLSALVIGPLLTAHSLTAYVTDPLFFDYFKNLLGMIQYELPGMFLTNKTTTVNVQLWTIPIELDCYLIAVLLLALGVARRTNMLLWLLLAVNFGYLTFALATGHQYQGRPPHGFIIICFVAGILLYSARSLVPHTFSLFLAASLVAWHCMTTSSLLYLAPLPLSYAVIYLGCLNPSIAHVSQLANYSYGVFLYGFIVQQLVFALLPFAREWHTNFLISLPFAILLGALSWHAVEAPIAASRKAIADFLHKQP